MRRDTVDNVTRHAEAAQSGAVPEVPFDLRDEFGNQEANLRFLEMVGPGPRERTLEIGCGKGGLLHILRQQGRDVRGVEIDEWMIAESRRLYGDLPITASDGYELGYPDGMFDVVISFDVIEHIPDTDRHLREVHRLLRPGGRYLLQTPNRWTNTVFETIRWRSFTAWRRVHCSLHSSGQLRARFSRHGFDVQFHDVPVVNDFFRRKIRRYLGSPGLWLLRVLNPDRWPLPIRTNFYVSATRRG